MKLYLYDFDGTIYDGDSTLHFFIYCFKKGYLKISHIIKVIFKIVAYKLKYISVTEAKEAAFAFLNNIPDIETEINEFWDQHRHKLKDFYLKKNHRQDVIISASPFFLLKPICDELKVKDLIASDVDSKTGKFDKPNCRGKQKVIEFGKKYPKAKILEMYSDSEHDKPLLDIAEKSFMVKKDKIYDYRTYRPNLLKRFWRWGWGIYHQNEELWNYLVVGGLTTFVSIGAYAFFAKGINLYYQVANVLSWVVAVIFAYFANRWFVFHSENSKKVKEFITFTGSRVITLLLDMSIMYSFIELLKINDLIAKVFAQVVIVVVNYLISKLLVFNKNVEK